MRRPNRTNLIGIVASSLLVGVMGCERGKPGDSAAVAVPGVDGAVKSAAGVRAQRRAYDGAPPVIPHAVFGMECTQCHNERGMDVSGVGFAPPSPHGGTTGLSLISNCKQCHVFKTTDALLVANSFAGLEQDLRVGERHHPLAPPVIPHQAFMRENCLACHTGPAAREDIRCDHPERVNCRQCHVAAQSRLQFASSLGGE